MTARKTESKTPEPQQTEVDTESRSLGERLAKVEVEINHRATKADLENIKVQFFWAIFSSLFGVISFVALLYRIFGNGN